MRLFSLPHIFLILVKLFTLKLGRDSLSKYMIKKVESWILKSGQAKVIWENDQGELIETELTQDKGYTSIVGQRHRLVGITDCDVFEVSTPEIGVTYRLEDDYKRPDETEEMRKAERTGE